MEIDAAEYKTLKAECDLLRIARTHSYGLAGRIVTSIDLLAGLLSEDKSIQLSRKQQEILDSIFKVALENQVHHEDVIKEIRKLRGQEFEDD